MKMESDFETLLDVALGGPEIGPLNLSILHGLLREVFQKFDLSSKKISIKEDNPDFSTSFNFIKSKLDEKNDTPRTSGGGYQKLRSKVSVIVADYARTPVGQSNENKAPLLPADAEDRLRYLESELKIVKNFPSVDELRSWAQEKTSPDTVVTDLWHFVSLNHRMNGAEEGIQKLTELVDKLIPELKKLTDGQIHIQGQIDDLYSQFQGLSDRATRLDDRLDNAGNSAEEKLEHILGQLNDVNLKMNGYAKLMDLEDFVLKDTFVEAQGRANTMADQFNEELATKAPISMLDDLVDQGELQRLKDWVSTLRAQMETVPSKDDLAHLDLYVKWPQLEDALFSYPSRPPSRSNSYDNQNGSALEGRLSSRKSSRRSVTSSRKLYPTDTCLQKLNELGSMADRQNSLMDALEKTREQLAEKADKSDLKNFVTQEDLNDILHLLKNLREDLNGMQSWRTAVDEEKMPEFRNLLNDLDGQISGLLSDVTVLQEKDKQKGKALENLFTYVDRLEENKLDKDDPLLLEIKYANNTGLPTSPLSSNNNDDISEDTLLNGNGVDGELKRLDELIKKLQEKINDMNVSYDKSLNDILNELDDKLDRAELEPLREYLESQYNNLSQQQQQKQQPFDDVNVSNSCNVPHKPSKRVSHSAGYEHNIPSDEKVKKPSSQSNYGKSLKTSKSAPSSKPSSRMNGVFYDTPTSDSLGCSHPHYGEGGFTPLKKNAAMMKAQMKFNCLSCDRPLTMQSDSYFQTVRGKDRPLTGYELDQLKLLQKILKGDNPNKSIRACGGKHTSSIPPSSAKRLTPKLNATFPTVSNADYLVATDLIDNEIDIEGLDGRFYRGLLSNKDLPSNLHLRSRSANDNLRTVSPSPRGGANRPVSGKSLDFNSSFTSGLGHGSMDIHIQ